VLYLYGVANFGMNFARSIEEAFFDLPTQFTRVKFFHGHCDFAG
jgi:hypothetical protein